MPWTTSQKLRPLQEGNIFFLFVRSIGGMSYMSIILTFYSSRVNDENRWMDTPERGGAAGSKSARKMFGSIERGLDRVRLMLTPRRRQLHRTGGETEFSSSGPNVVDNKVIYKRYLNNCLSKSQCLL